ncbi:PepSY domain-containing protein [Acaryochloris marina NIES-2412]|uniref:PepSY domain-containing protein n=1 Tax=Acaryochloris marina TaxID=155978 RepID=UPI00405950B9
MTSIKLNLRRLHRALAPLLCVPLVLTVTSGMLFQMAATNQQGDQFLWLLDLHRGKFGRFNLETVYPYLNGLGLLTLILTGTLMWLQLPSKRDRL